MPGNGSPAGGDARTEKCEAPSTALSATLEYWQLLERSFTLLRVFRGLRGSYSGSTRAKQC
jgi:hypothetical protein